jgi:hypothetical protein
MRDTVANNMVSGDQLPATPWVQGDLVLEDFGALRQGCVNAISDSIRCIEIGWEKRQPFNVIVHCSLRITIEP